MHLKSITLKGFKSFPDRTRLELEPGVSVIVGPNGSGKSNVTDAVLWALGEQSPIAVRGHSMQDVIFAGVPGRQAARSAEVELVLDDSDGTLALGAPEISIVRRLERTGEGEYRIAGARCRLVDVIELLSDTGLGKEMHSVISQGRVESIISSKPRDRRLLIEEAAGLGKHRKRRRRAQLKLERTQDNLARALDIEREARSRLRPLRRQAEAAELHARLERQSQEARWELLRDQLLRRQAALGQAQDETDQARARRALLERELHGVAGHRQAAEEALAGRSAQREELSRRCFLARSVGERVADRVHSTRASRSAIDARVTRARTLLSPLEDQEGGAAVDPRSGARIAALQAELDALHRDREAELRRQLAELERQLHAARTGVAERTDAAERARSAREQADQRLEQARGTMRDCERMVEAARREAARVGGELAAVNQFLRSRQSSPHHASSLADELEVDSGYELALAAALDGRLLAALAGDLQDATRVLDRAGAEGGRALVTEARPGASPIADPEPPVAGAERLIERVRGREDTVELARVLLADAWVLDDVRGVPESFTGVAVTLSGRVFSPATRELRQAPAVGEERVLAERNRRERLMAASERAVRAEQEARSGLDRAGAETNSHEAERQRAIAADRAAVRALDEASEHQRRIEALIANRRSAPDEGPAAGRRAQLAAELGVERAAIERAQREREQREARIARLRATVAAGEALAPLVVSVIEALESAASAISEQRKAFEAALTADRETGEHVAAELRSYAQQEATLHAQLQGENESLTALEVRAQRLRDQVDEAVHALGELAGALELEAQPARVELGASEREALSSRVERLRRRREQLGPVNPLAQAQYNEAVEQVEELERQREDLETALRELQKLIAETDRHIREVFEQTFDATARNFEELSEQLFPGGRGRLRLLTGGDRPARVLSGDEPVGRAAGLRAGGPGEDAGREIDDEELGVEIEVVPAGGDFKRLSLLSGGEKSLTALAFLFAVFLAKPCPFYILDEVEAALDDINMDRFLALLRRYSERAQFIVVTHQKRTMEVADSLYGVSMGSDGVSKVISRRLPRAA